MGNAPESKYRKPTLLEWLGHVYIGHSSDNYSHFAATLVTGAIATCGGALTLPFVADRLLAGEFKEAAAAALITGLSLIPIGIQTWLLGTEGWSPEYQALEEKRNTAMDGEIIPPQL